MVTANGSCWGIWKPACRGWEGDLADARGERRPASVASVSSSALSVSPRRGGGGTASAPWSLQAGFVGEGNTQMLGM